MNALSPELMATHTSGRARVALLVDGENLGDRHAGPLIIQAAKHGAVTVKRVYGDAARLPRWDAAPGYRLIHAGRGKNAADLLLCIEALALVHDRLADVIVLASNDGDFSHIASHLRERGIPVYGMGEATAPENWRKSCTGFVELKAAPGPTQTSAPKPAHVLPANLPEAALLKDVENLLRDSTSGGALPLTKIGQELKGRLKATGHASWGKFLSAHSDRFRLDKSTPGGSVRLL
jgi:hypothetical protein